LAELDEFKTKINEGKDFGDTELSKKDFDEYFCDVY
jgi:hypothetical protein